MTSGRKSWSSGAGDPSVERRGSVSAMTDGREREEMEGGREREGGRRGRKKREKRERGIKERGRAKERKGQ